MTCVRQNQESCGGALRMLKTRAFWDLFFMIMLIQGAVGGVFQGLHLLQHLLVQHL